MNINTKNIILALVIGTLGVCFYYGFSPVSDEPREGVILLPTLNSSGAIETDSGKRIETVGNSGTNWGMTPFGSGKPLEEIPEETLKFQKPSTEWKTRTISGITYVFGEGNPVGAKPLSETEINAYKNCIHEPELSQISCGSPYDETNGYITAELEKDLLILISNKNWEPILMNCEQQFRQYEFSDWEATYNKVMYHNFMNMENMITINPENGRKEIMFANFGHLESWFKNALLERKDIRGEATLSINNCITQNGGFELYRLFDIVHQKQFYPFGNYPDRIIDPKKYVPWH